MNETLNKLYYGEICPCKEASPENKKYKEISKKISELTESVIRKYPDISDELTELIEEQHLLTALESEADFERGFRLGVWLMIDTLYNIE